MASQPPSDAQVQTVAAILAAGLITQAAVVALASALAVTPAVALAALTLARQPTRATVTIGPATSATLSAEALYRAAFLAASARRIQNAIDAGTSLAEAVNAERSYFDAHRQAQQNRLVTASKVDDAARRFGPQLGWYAVMDTKTSAECAAANGKNFDAARRPLIGWPGSVHPHCRCQPGAPHVGAGLVDTATRDVTRETAAGREAA